MGTKEMYQLPFIKMFQVKTHTQLLGASTSPVGTGSNSEMDLGN
ncbi:MAG: hypothetical protein Q4E55_04090 [Bacteroidales bacterium]|nr:hypothetical protein [Bacteroidales bacterium]